MKKEKGLYVMNTEKGAFLKTAEFDNELTFKCNFDQAICNAQPLAAIDYDRDFPEHHQRFAKSLAEFLSQDGVKKVPVIIEFDIKVTGLDGTEYNVEEIVAEAEKNGGNSKEQAFAELMRMLAGNK